MSRPVTPGDTTGETGLANLDWSTLLGELDDQGRAMIPGLLTPQTCRSLAAMYGEDNRFRNRVIMARHGYGRGEYRYFDYPLPEQVDSLRQAFYTRLAPLANRWYETMKLPQRFPARHADFIAECRAAGQSRPTPLLLQYGEGDYNCLHQDVYGERLFPLQVAILLSRPGEDFEGGEFLLTEQRPRMQSRGEVLPLQQGDALIFAVRERPRLGRRGYHRVNMRHGVSTVRAGHRHTLGIIFHDAA